MNNRKSQSTTDKLLSLGMALNADRATMEQRIRGIFSRKKSGIAALTAAMPEAVARASSAPSSMHMRFSNMSLVGLP